MSRREDELNLRQLRRKLDENFKPIFEKHEKEGLPIGDLRHELEDEGLLEHIPRRRMEYLLQQADTDGDKHMNYNEFTYMVCYDLTSEERKPFRRVMMAAMGDLVPSGMKKDFLANYTCCPPPLFIPIITAIEIVVFFVYVADMTEKGMEVTATSGVAMYSPLVYKADKRQEVWRFLTYMLMHDGYMHILSNMIFQVFFGTLLEVVHKWWRVGLVYLLGTIAGSLAHSCTDYNVSLVGASGGAYAILGAHVAAIVTNWKEMNYKCMDPNDLDDKPASGVCRILLSAPVRLLIILLLVVPDTSLAIYRRINAPEESKVGVTAHIGGFVAGLFLGIVLLKNIQTLEWEKSLGWITLAMFLAFVAFACIFNALYDGYPETDW